MQADPALSNREEFPTYELDYRVDDEDDPQVVTVYLDGAPEPTRWLSIDLRHAVALEDVA